MEAITGNEYLNNIPLIWRRTEDAGSGYRTTKIKKTKYGYIIHRFSNYISLQYIRFEILPNGFYKAIIKVDTNYRQKYQFTMYFDDNMNEVNDRKMWVELYRNN